VSPAPAAFRGARAPANFRAAFAAAPCRAACALAILLLAATFLTGFSGCARRADDRAGATAEREEIRAGRRILLKSRLSPRRVTLGDPVAWTLSAELPATAVPGRLLRTPAGPELDIRAPRAPRSETARPRGTKAADRTVWVWPYEVRGFGLGAIALPAVRLPVAYGSARDTLLFPSDTLAVDSLTRAASGSVLPDRGPVTPELRPLDYAVAAGLLVLLIVAGFLIARAIRRRRERAEAPAVPAEPADAVLRREIAALRAEGEPLPRDTFYDRLSLAIRDYAAAATGITTRDRTTMEIVRDLRVRPAIPPDGVDALRRALSRADLAKFARRGGGWDEALEVLEIAERLPDRLPARPPAPAEPAEPPAPARAGGG
jgi:hypothetical protein